ncbi:MAG: membrane-bound lytic murein transglycosylase MltF [Porticoccaceae bacterium]
MDQLSTVQKRAGIQFALAAIISLATVVQPGSRALTVLELVRSQGTLRVATVSGLTTYFEDASGSNGFEYLLAKSFADSLGVRLDVRLYDNTATLSDTLNSAEADFATARLIAKTNAWQSLRFSIPYYNVEQKLIYPLGRRKPWSLADLRDGEIVILPDRLQSENLMRLRQSNSRLTWTTAWGIDSADLIERIHSGAVNYAIVDSASYAANHNFYPRARAAFSATSAEPVGWAFPGHGDDSLIVAANQFLQNYAKSGELGRLQRLFFDRGTELSLNISQEFLDDLIRLLPEYKNLFISIAAEYDLDWHLLAAIAYQESRWDSQATSPTGVRGLMMLTERTAQEMGVKDRLDATQSLRGGAKYFLQLRGRIADRIEEPDRTWLALAAYNIGLGHLEDARVLTERNGKNPNHWDDVKQHLPMLQREEHYTSVKYGFARGGESATFVKRVRRYTEILGWHNREQELLAARRRIYIPSSNDLGEDQKRL